MEACPLCQTANASVDATTLIYGVSCQACGRYDITKAAYDFVLKQKKLAYAVAFWVSEQVSFGLIPLVDETLVESIRARPIPTVKRRAERYLSAVIGLLDGRLSGAFSPFDPKLLVASQSRSQADAVALAQFWVTAGAVRHAEPPSHHFVLMAKAHFILDEMMQQRAGSTQCFVAMSFSEDMHTVYQDGIRPAVEASGYEPLRLDRKHYDGKVDDEIILEIRRSAFLVADFTKHRGGVYYEAGFAHGLGRRVIFTCRQDDVANLHFDVRQYNTITWANPVDLVDPLRNRILALFGSGPLQPDVSTTS